MSRNAHLLYRNLKTFSFKNDQVRLLTCPTTQFGFLQGQITQKNTREYFYYIDHNGMLFLDDVKIKNFTSCFKDKKFLAFFYKRLRANKTGQYEEIFPYVSPCGNEMNYIRCDDVPVVYTEIIANEAEKTDILNCGYVGTSLSMEFQPTELCMVPQTGRVYHPADNKYGGVGLLKSSLAIQLSQYFKFADGEDKPPTEFTWKNKHYKLNNSLHTKLSI
ncbi:hypothetical protein CHUAL_008570 [Chamberlinius hualienensis]